MKIELVIELTIAPEVNPYRGEQTDASEVEWFEDHLLADELILHSNLIGSEVGTVRVVKRDDYYRAWYEEAIVASNEAGFVGMSAAQVIVYQDGEIMRLRAEVEGLVEALELARRTLAMAALEGEVTRRIDSALAAYRQGGAE